MSESRKALEAHEWVWDTLPNEVQEALIADWSRLAEAVKVLEELCDAAEWAEGVLYNEEYNTDPVKDPLHKAQLFLSSLEEKGE